MFASIDIYEISCDIGLICNYLKILVTSLKFLYKIHNNIVFMAYELILWDRMQSR